MSPQYLSLQIEELEGVTVVRLFVNPGVTNHCDSELERFMQELTALANDDGRKKLVLDFSDVNYLSSAIIAALCPLAFRIRKSNGQKRLRSCCMNEHVMAVFQITSIYVSWKLLFNPCPTLEEALKGF